MRVIAKLKMVVHVYIRKEQEEEKKEEIKRLENITLSRGL
jgi:hypothetical protein